MCCKCIVTCTKCISRLENDPRVSGKSTETTTEPLAITSLTVFGGRIMMRGLISTFYHYESNPRNTPHEDSNTSSGLSSIENKYRELQVNVEE